MSSEAEDRRFQRQLNSGATSLALLGLLANASRPMYGYEIPKQLDRRCSGNLPMNQGALYPVLRSLEEQDMLTSHLEPSAEGPARKYYKITIAGRQTLRRWLFAWRATTEFVNAVLENEHARQPNRSDSSVLGKSGRRIKKA